MRISSYKNILRLKSRTLTGLGKMFGEEAVINRICIQLYSNEDFGEKIKGIRKSNMKKYLLVMLCISIIGIAYAVSEITDTKEGLIKKDNEIIGVIRPENGENLTVLLSATHGGEILRNEKIIVKPYALNEEILQQEELVEIKRDEIQEFLRTINKSRDNRKIYLPKKLGDGREISWQTQKESPIMPLLIFMVMGFIVVYLSRHNSIKNEAEEARKSVKKELADFMNKIVLLLNAGLVLNSAFQYIMEDYKNIEAENKSYFYERLSDISIAVRETNTTFHIELRSFAKASGVREFMRLTEIIYENMNKGTELTAKLQRESEHLWFSKRKEVEEKGRLSETKMTFPLVILLMVLILITITPAMIEIR